MSPLAWLIAAAAGCLAVYAVWTRFGELVKVVRTPAAPDAAGRIAAVRAAAAKAVRELLILDYRREADAAVSENGDVGRTLVGRLKDEPRLSILYATAVDEPSWLGDSLRGLERATFAPGTLAPSRNQFAVIADRAWLYVIPGFGRPAVYDLERVQNEEVRRMFTGRYLEDADTVDEIVRGVRLEIGGAGARGPAPRPRA